MGPLRGIALTLLLLESNKDPPKFDILQCSTETTYYEEEINDQYVRLLIDKTDPPGDGDEDDIDMLLSNIKEEIRMITEENLDLISDTYKLYGKLAQHEKFEYNEENTNYINAKINLLFNINEGELKNLLNYL
jgi:hypothetical protein